MESYMTLKAKAIALAKEHAAKISLSILTALALLIAIVLWHYFNGFRLSLEELLGIVAVTTFLVGFASVRLQSNQESWKESASRLINRVLEQNANDDLLPMPTSFSQYKTTEKFVPRDNAAKITSVLTWSTFGISSYLIYMHWRNYGKVAELLLIQIIHLAIAVTNSVEPYFAKRYSEKYTERQPFGRYEKLSEALVDYCITDEENQKEIKIKEKRVREAVEGLDESLPSWCWLDLIRCHIDPENVRGLHRPQLKRLREMAKTTKHFDDFSNIVFVWTTYLLDKKDNKQASISIRYADIHRIMEFSKETVRQGPPGQSLYERQIWYGGDIYAEMTLRCVYKSWTGKETLEKPLKKSAETELTPLTKLGNHLKKTKDDRASCQEIDNG